MKAFSFVILLAVIFFILWMAYFTFMLGPLEATIVEGGDHSVATSTLSFSIQKGDGLDMIAAKLESSKLIRSASIFKLYSFFKGVAHQLKPGLYEIAHASSVPQLIATFVQGPANHATVVIPEGWTLVQIDGRLAELGIIKAGEIEDLSIQHFTADYRFLRLVDSLEGYLFPDTYDFALDADAKDVVRRMLDAFEEKALPVLELSDTSVQDTLIIASMIEKEVPDPKERRIVAGLIENRLELGMVLQIDATTLYARDHGEIYDTYKVSGLPPGPIANPGLDAIRSVIEAEQTEYFYYLSHPQTKETIFSKTFEEHDEKRAQYLR
ncbi:MAG: endolytic transglycosylase MltG [Candidatus Harrisonbacteria bacterium]|nr:endolytic transglycosylase MltG [Candidatus Harrisonbacteria bacterium]